MVKKLSGRKADLLKQADIFSSLLPGDIDVLAAGSEILGYKPDEAVFSMDDPGNALYIVESGEVVVQKLDESRRKIDIARFVSGNCFGELDLFTENVRDAFAHASTETRLLVFPESETGFSTFLEKHPALSARILHEILVKIAVRIRSANALIKDNSPLVQELRRQVYLDKLTGIFNQAYITETIQKLIKRDEGGFALIIVKPDNFKDLNDTYGHDAGDSAIRIIARGLQNFIGDEERVARYKGNAMAVLLPGVGRKEAFTEAESIREYISCLDVTEATDGNIFTITSSIGITIFPEHGIGAEDLLILTHELPLIGRSRGGNKILFPEDSGEV